MSKRLARWVSWIFIAISFAVIGSVNTLADPLVSTNYRVDESVVGVGDMNIGSSANYQAVNSTGDIGVGNATSGNYQIEAGHTTTPDPALSFVINNGGVNFGSFTAASATVTTTTFTIGNYTSWGYAVQMVGSSLSNNGHTITAMSTSDTSHSGTEQFGINLVANTSPVSVGSNPDNGQFGFGAVATNYNSANNYKFVSGDTIAVAPKSSGITTYTITYLVNVNSLTPGGQYTGDQTLIITGTY